MSRAHPHVVSEPERRRFTADEVLALTRLLDLEGYELLDGDLIVVPAKGPLHRLIASRLEKRLDRRLPQGFHARKEESVAGDRVSLPEPDVAIVRGELEDYRDRLPEGKDVVVAIEVAASTLEKDRNKLPLYARAGVPTVWILAVPERRLEVYTDNRGDRYATSFERSDVEDIEVPVVGERWTIASMID
jgi:Uma2 family endonuclease